MSNRMRTLLLLCMLCIAGLSLFSRAIVHEFNDPAELEAWEFIYERLPSHAPKIAEDLENRDPSETGMLAVKGAELDSPHHIVSLFSDLTWRYEDTYAVLFERADNKGGLLFWAHPNSYHGPDDWDWYTGYFYEHDLLLGMEVYHEQSESIGLWDNILAELMPGRPVWGFATDDMHHSRQLDQNWTVLLMQELNRQELSESLQKGSFYMVSRQEGDGSAPPSIESIQVDEDMGTIEIEASRFESIEWISGGEIIASGFSLEYSTNESINGYVRVKIAGPGGITASQPFGFDKDDNGLFLTLNPYRDSCWDSDRHFKAQFHTHTTVSDGYYHPHQVVDLYQDKEYDILALTDHNRVTYPWEEFTSWEGIDEPYVEGGKLILLNPRARLAPRGIWARGRLKPDDFHYSVTFRVTTPLTDYQYVRIPFMIQAPFQYFELFMEHRNILLRRYDGDPGDFENIYLSWQRGIQTGEWYTIDIIGLEDSLQIMMNDEEIISLDNIQAEPYYGGFGLRPDQNMFLDSLVEVERVIIRSNKTTAETARSNYQ